MKKAISVLSVIFSATAFHISAEIPQDMQQEFSAPGPAGKITVQVSGECRGKLIYEAQDFTANTYANPNSQGHAYFTAHIPKANPIYGHFTATRQATNKIFRLKKQA